MRCNINSLASVKYGILKDSLSQKVPCHTWRSSILVLPLIHERSSNTVQHTRCNRNLATAWRQSANETVHRDPLNREFRKTVYYKGSLAHACRNSILLHTLAPFEQNILSIAGPVVSYTIHFFMISTSSHHYYVNGLTSVVSIICIQLEYPQIG